jgi:hypothetical protein
VVVGGALPAGTRTWKVEPGRRLSCESAPWSRPMILDAGRVPRSPGRSGGRSDQSRHRGRESAAGRSLQPCPLTDAHVPRVQTRRGICGDRPSIPERCRCPAGPVGPACPMLSGTGGSRRGGSTADKGNCRGPARVSFAWLFPSGRVELTVTEPPNPSGRRSLGLDVRTKALEIRPVDRSPARPDHSKADVKSVGAVDVEERTPIGIDCRLRRIQ